MTYPTKAIIKRAIETARELGLDVTGFEITPSGGVKTTFKKAPDTVYLESEVVSWLDEKQE